MLTSFSINNFRCFSDLKIDGLERINLIAGKNNVGKSALLEAIHLHCQPDKPHLWIKVHRLRGIENPLEAKEDLAEWLFFQGRSNRPIRAESRDASGLERSTELSLVDAETSRQRFPDLEAKIGRYFSAIAGSDLPRLVLRYSVAGHHYESMTLAEKVGQSGHASLNANGPQKVFNLFLGSLIADEERDIRNFEALEKQKRLDEILPALRHMDDRLKGLSLLHFAGKPTIHADVEGIAKLVPLSLVGEGMRRLLSILAAIANVPGGIVFIDEIENGLHYSVQAQIWSAVAQAARRADVQVFATTHSWECVRYAHEAFCEDAVDDFRLHRLDRIDDENTVTTYDREMMEAALATGVEVR